MKRFGFTLMEVAVAAALIAILASATVPTFIDYLDMRNAETTAKALAAIGNGIISYQSIVHTNGGTTNVYPDSISSLTNPIAVTTRNSCNVAYNNGGANTSTLLSTFNSAFPYATFYIPFGGYPTPLGNVDATVTRNTGNTSMSITMTGIDSMDAARLERYIDGDDVNITANQTGGTFRVTGFTGGGGTPKKANVGYVIPVAAKC